VSTIYLIHLTDEKKKINLKSFNVNINVIISSPVIKRKMKKIRNIKSIKYRTLSRKHLLREYDIDKDEIGSV